MSEMTESRIERGKRYSDPLLSKLLFTGAYALFGPIFTVSMLFMLLAMMLMLVVLLLVIAPFAGILAAVEEIWLPPKSSEGTNGERIE